MIILTQKSAIVNDKLIAYVDITLNDGKYTYPLIVQKYAKSRFNAYLRSLGFIIGVVDTPPIDKAIEI